MTTYDRPHNPSRFIEVFEPQVMPNGDYAASAHVHLGPEGSIRILATAPRAVAAKAMAHAQAFASKHLRPGAPSSTVPPPAPMPPLPPVMPPTLAIPPGIRPPPSMPAPTSAMTHARSLLHHAATSQPLAAETARLARRFVPMLRPLSGAVRTPAAMTTRGGADLAQLCERAVMLLEAAERDPEARERLAEAVRRARRDGRLLRVLQAVRAAERRDGPDGVDALKRLAGAASLLSRADGGDREALERLQRVIGGALSPAQDAEPSAARAAGYLSVADTELVTPSSTARPEVGAAHDGADHDDDPNLLELVRALRGMRAGYRRRAAR